MKCIYCKRRMKPFPNDEWRFKCSCGGVANTIFWKEPKEATGLECGDNGDKAAQDNASAFPIDARPITLEGRTE